MRVERGGPKASRPAPFLGRMGAGRVPSAARIAPTNSVTSTHQADKPVFNADPIAADLTLDSAEHLKNQHPLAKTEFFFVIAAMIGNELYLQGHRFLTPELFKAALDNLRQRNPRMFFSPEEASHLRNTRPPKALRPVRRRIDITKIEPTRRRRSRN